MTDINFIEINAKEILTHMIADVEEELGETLYPSDERRIFLYQLAQFIIGLRNDINDSARQNLLRYARGDIQDALGELTNTKRLQSQKAFASYKFVLSAPQNNIITIKKGTRVTPDGTLYFEVKEDIYVQPGIETVDTIVEATEPGKKHNGFTPGQIKNIVDPIPYIKEGYNTSITTGGADIEDDESYRERIRLAAESFSTAGPGGAYEYFARSADSTISDISVVSPRPGVVRIIALQKDGEIPGEEVLQKIDNAVNARNKRPLTDFVEVVGATEAKYDIQVKYYLDKDHIADETKYRKAIEGQELNYQDGAIRDYINWQQERLGRELNPDVLRYKIQDAATYMKQDKTLTAVTRVIITSPVYTTLTEEQVAKPLVINVTYGGVE